MEKIILPGGPAPLGPYSPAMKVGNLVITSGQIGGTEGDIKAQTEKSCQSVVALLEAAGTDAQHVVKTTCFLTDINDFAAFNEVYGKYFTEKPARSCVAVAALPGGNHVEIEAIAEIPCCCCKDK